MVLLKPSKEDITKIHSEINQIVNQKFLTITLAITVFGVMTAWQFQRDIPTKGSVLDPLFYYTTIIQTIVLLGLFINTWTLKKQLRLYSTFLFVVSEKGLDDTSWELNWSQYRKKYRFYPGYTKFQSLLFFSLIIITGFLPIIITNAYQLLSNCLLEELVIIVTLISLFIIIILGILGLGDNEDKYLANWRNL